MKDVHASGHPARLTALPNIAHCVSNTFGVRIPLGVEYLWGSNTFDFGYLWVLYRRGDRIASETIGPIISYLGRAAGSFGVIVAALERRSTD